MPARSWSKTIEWKVPPRDVLLGEVLTAEEAERRRQETALRASYDKGRQEAEESLTDQLLQQRTEVQELFKGALRSLQEAVPKVVRDTEQMLVGLTLEIAQKIVTDIPITTELVEVAVREALSQVEGASEFVIRLHPADLELLEKNGSEMLKDSADSGQWRFLSSSEVTRGGCLVKTRFGIIDARRETKFDMLKRSLQP